jgi:hypothetical protein
MPLRFDSNSQETLFEAIRGNLGRIGYSDALLATDYRFGDYFSSDPVERLAPAAAFGQTPPSYQTACFAVLLTSDRRRGVELIQQYRALGAPLAFEVSDDFVGFWRVAKSAATTVRLNKFSIDNLGEAFNKYGDQWSPHSILRAKNIASIPPARQRDLFDFDYELVPELEHRIREKLDPMVQDACSVARNTYRETEGADPNPRQLFQLAFWLLAGRIFHDRHIDEFAYLPKDVSADAVLELVAKHYGQKMPVLLNEHARQAVHKILWSGFDFRNLSVDVLTHIWANTFVTPDVRKEHGIHPTPRPIAKYIVDAVPFEDIELPADRYVLEPCCGSATFLVSALQRLRDQPEQSHDERARHKYFQEHLIGFERDPFGVEISQLCLTLADFPNSNGWLLYDHDIFQSPDFIEALNKSRIVLCNPPFETFGQTNVIRERVESVLQPAAILQLVLEHLHPDGMIGFVMPRAVIDGDGYAAIRTSLAERFNQLHILALPENAFETAEHETALVIAYEPKKASSPPTVRLRYAEVAKSDWPRFRDFYETTSDDNAVVKVSDVKKRLAIRQLERVWASVKHLKTLRDIAEVRRGFEWTLPLTEINPSTHLRRETGNRDVLVRDEGGPDYKKGIRPQKRQSENPIYSYQIPNTAYLRMRLEDQRSNSYDKPWDRPKIIVNKARRARGNWRIAAFADLEGLVFYQTLQGVWPHDETLTIALSAVLNGPLANAFVATSESRDVTADTLYDIPIPKFDKQQLQLLSMLVSAYVTLAGTDEPLQSDKNQELGDLLRRIDAVVLNAYDLPARVERELLNFFNNQHRPVPFEFGSYFPQNFSPSYSLSEYLSPDFKQLTVQQLLERMGQE